ncbi:DNA primase [Comamonas sp. NLF-1-9]|uniref:DNA primase n=1 Tax=Comamonas sp. NLF-1-9 TaxID=2853163 RepID=UPI001C45C3D5|nr:DNA primase [Comamonas sp. NLF-1-9]QXL84856.1 DNA primase [Comamonas sp. NLF-1-9]
MAIPQSFIQELIERTDVVELIGRYVQLRKSGANYMGLCPFHTEKSASFSVSPSKQFFHCFGCGRSGNAIGFLMESQGMGFREAVQDLAQHAGMQLPEEERSPQERERAQAQRQQQATLSEVLARAARAYCAQLRTAPQAIAYLKGRGVSGALAKRYALGWAGGGWHGLASVFAEYDSPLLVQSGLVIESEEDGRRYDRFRERVMFPIRNLKGECIGFGGRVLGDEKPKYLNSPETPVFHKGRELYGLFEARQAIREAGHVLVTEGYMDVVALAQLGFGNVVATLGTACTPEHVHKLFRFSDQVVFSFDGDEAGRRAARKALDAALPYASDTRTVKFLFLPPEHDPDSYVRSFGHDAFARLVGDALPLSRFMLQVASEACDLGSAEGRAHMLSKAQPLWAALPEGALKPQLLAQFAERGQIAPEQLQSLWTKERVAHTGQGFEADSTGYRSWRKGNDWRGPRTPGARVRTQAPLARTPGRRRSDHALRLLLSHMAFLHTLDAEDRQALAALPAPHGTLFLWLEDQWHERGVLPWAQLGPALQGHECEPLAQRIMTGSHAQTEGDEAELRAELQDLLARMHIENIEREQSALIAASASDPTALARYRQLEERRRALKNGSSGGAAPRENKPA